MGIALAGMQLSDTCGQRISNLLLVGAGVRPKGKLPRQPLRGICWERPYDCRRKASIQFPHAAFRSEQRQVSPQAHIIVAARRGNLRRWQHTTLLYLLCDGLVQV